jgi:hypothetical protein
VIEPRLDPYGKEADVSALADYMELLALADTPITEAELADLIADNDWHARSPTLSKGSGLVPPDDAGGLAENPGQEEARRVFDALRERVDILARRYPFELDGPRLVVRDPANGEAYLTLLAITIAHAYSLNGEIPNPTSVLEEAVARVMAARGLEVANTGMAGRGPGGFENVLQQAADLTQLASVPEAAPYRTRAKEQGVDTVAHLWWGDRRAGHWVFIGQVTCAKSEDWSRKIAEPAPRAWGPWLGCLIDPQAFLAVPHHVMPWHMRELTHHTGRFVLDRLRMVPFLRDRTFDEQALVKRVMGERVFEP